MRIIIISLLISLMGGGLVFADMTFEVKEGKAVITETLLAQPVQIGGPKGGPIAIPGVTQDIVTKIEITKEQAQAQLIQLNKKKIGIMSGYNKTIESIEAQIKILQDIDAALPDESLIP